MLRKMFERLRPRRQRRETPTATIYFAHAMAHFIGDDETSPVQRIEPTVFLCGNKLLIARHWSGTTQKLLLDRPALAVIYLIDDDLWQLDEVDGLPTGYKARLARLRRDFDAQLSNRVSKIISPSERILEALKTYDTGQLDPGLIYKLPLLEHHVSRGPEFSVVFSATASHLADLVSVSDDLAGFFRRQPDAQLTTFLGNQAPNALQLPNCRHERPMSWNEFRAALPRFCFHAGIAPANPTSFNASRSASRVLDHAAFGAAGLYSSGSGPAEALTHGEDSLLVPSKPGAWAEALGRLYQDRNLCRSLAAAGQSRAREIGDLDRLRTFWIRELELPES